MAATLSTKVTHSKVKLLECDCWPFYSHQVHIAVVILEIKTVYVDLDSIWTGAKLTSEKVKTLSWHFEVPRWSSRDDRQKGVWMIKKVAGED